MMALFFRSQNEDGFHLNGMLHRSNKREKVTLIPHEMTAIVHAVRCIGEFLTIQVRSCHVWLSF
jgi:hypothetical protein